MKIRCARPNFHGALSDCQKRQRLVYTIRATNRSLVVIVKSENRSFKPSILITGATGFLGGALTVELLSTNDWDNVLLLARGDDAAQAHARVLQALAKFGLKPQELARIRQEQVLCADFSEPAAFVQDPRLASIRKVVHCAAITSFGANTKVFTTNVEGTLRFVHHLRQVAQIERFLHVSTAMICGDQPSTVVHEDDYPRPGVQHLVNYTESKAQVENLLKITLPGFPLVIVRPSIIVGHTRLGCKPSGSIFWTFRISDALQAITCRADGYIDVVPGDYAARALSLLLRKKTLAHTVYHISSGLAASCRWPELAEAFARSRGVSKAPFPRYESVHLADVELRKPEFDSLFGHCNKAFMMRAIRLYGTFAGLNCVFANDRLIAEGAEAPPRFSDYLGLCVQSTSHMSVAEHMMIDF
jgi:nucleoside-diphosphate-sugar epimerase